MHEGSANICKGILANHTNVLVVTYWFIQILSKPLDLLIPNFLFLMYFKYINATYLYFSILHFIIDRYAV